MERFKIYNTDCVEFMKGMEPSEIDAIITDPPYDGYLPFYDMLRVTTGNVIVFCKPENQWFKPDEFLFWIKTPSTKNYVKACGRFVEIILVHRSPKGAFNQLHWSQMTGVYDDRLIHPPAHPYEKPLSLLERLVRIYTREGDTVFDPYMGIGTTGVAALNLGRKFVGCEKDPSFFNVAKNRLEKIT